MKKTDINGIEMKTGNIVEIKNAFFKNDNGIYFIAHTPGDPTWSGNDYSLRKMCKNGKISINSRNIAFWPLSAFTNNREKNRECREWNEANATIEIIFSVDNTAVVEHFRNEAEICKKQYDYNILYYGKCSRTDTEKAIYEFYLSLASEMETEKEPIKEITEQATPSVEKDEHQPETQSIDHQEEKESVKAGISFRKYYLINESSARLAKSMNSFSNYKDGEATETYKYYCNKVYDVLDQIRELKPQLTEKGESMTDRYCRKLAEYFNDYYRNEASCPSIMISGGSNFPVNKKYKQNSRRETLHNTWKYLQGYAEKINHLLTQEQPILSGDIDAIEQLETKISQLEEEHKHKLYCNNYYKKHGTLKGEGLAEKEIKEIEDFINRNPFFPPFIVCNDTSNIRRYKSRLDNLKKAKESEVKEEITVDQTGNELFKVLENTEIMRLQLFFDGKPDETTRSILKKNGFRWAPSYGAWQRQLTDSARYSLKRVKEALTA